MSVFSRWKEGLSRTSKAAFGQIAAILGASEITNETWDDLETVLIQADVGVETASSILEELKRLTRAEGWIRSDQLFFSLRHELLSRLAPPPEPRFENQPTVILIVGVNGSGKTTTIAKLASRFSDSGRKILLGAADTFRAAAVDQLQVWGDRLNVEVIAGAPESDPGAVAFSAVQAGSARGADIIMIDTAGRLHTRFNLMEELKKVHRVVGKAMAGAPHHVWLVLDATTGQNALQQARSFKDAVNVTGVILTKLDSSAKGGMAFAVRRELDLPILFVGLGERPEDLTPFDPEAFVDGILPKPQE
ncbi:MAG: signal recognition particle-docking protein FtsY [Chloroflexi bacterium]|nr:signal recognition particle-docking protein FtsY [Chloroflexi bacterium CFX1]MCK6568497.1 signal recognition particle-docking protein FtsY [Anaerolineales bacterium]MCQ3952799.1 signal recognition particle-docking protein FtsY [Chloroflexota bacterium]MDL1918026.1 signal recognition particle-docking protein FtsY [Chloroflexi bacterium CFX5]NUQ58601.1 signal recognition particle-docking protein FtsY [Anaerolineales bacterium]